MKKSLVIILIALLSNVVFAADNIEQMATTLGNSEQPTVGNNLLLNIKPRATTQPASWEEPTGTSGGSPISIVGGQVKKNGTSASGGGSAMGAGISNFNSGRRSSVTSGGTTISGGENIGGPRKVGGRPGEVPDEEAPVGAVPFAFMLLLAIGYGLYKKLIFDN
ncbi:MAG: hypothetical protein IJS73_01380 [Paludibacteraceae bacterium]|nr:hypothetical protein [Paludibacteraceae bacterium]